MRKSTKAKIAGVAGADWSRSQADGEVDPDARPITEEDVAAGRVRVVPKVFLTRRRLKLSQEEFAAQFHIPIGTLRDWEQRRKAPDAAAKAYLRVIALAPDVVRKALAARPPRRRAH
jgi:putative transcriptional regulator